MSEVQAYPLRVNDLKQFEYCPRIVFYNTVQPLERKATVKMERGAEVELRIEALERRRSLRRYGLAAGERRSRVWLRSDRLHLSGQLDMLITAKGEAFPVDFKHSRGRPQANHRLQLGGYALLVEDVLGIRVNAGFIYLVPLGELVRIPMTSELKARCLERLAMIRAMITEEWLPEPTPLRSRCTECEFRNYCGDIFEVGEE